MFILFSLVSFMFFEVIKSYNRYRRFKEVVLSLILSNVSSLVCNSLFVFLFVLICMSNVIGNIPTNIIPSLFYRQTATLSVLFWVALIFCVNVTQFKSFIAHLLPYGSPVSLSIFLPIIEGFSQIIRPFTLMVRLRTNISSGHIMVYMFSYFSMLSSTLAPSIYVVMSGLFLLEFFISILQAYIFVSLLVLYVHEANLE